MRHVVTRVFATTAAAVLTFGAISLSLPGTAFADDELSVQQLTAPASGVVVGVPLLPPPSDGGFSTCDHSSAPPRDDPAPPPSDGSQDKVHALSSSTCSSAAITSYVSSALWYLAPGSTQARLIIGTGNTVGNQVTPVSADAIAFSRGLAAGNYFTAGRHIYRYPYVLNTSAALPPHCNYGSSTTIGCYTKSRSVSKGGTHVV